MLSVAPAQADDLRAMLALLEASGLPQDGVGDHLATALVARGDGRVVGSAALELYGADALLRSVAVEPGLRGRGLGQRLTVEALALARDHGVTTIYLLTETAADFFARFGFRPISRDQVATAVQCSVECTTACPETAQAMVLDVLA